MGPTPEWSYWVGGIFFAVMNIFTASMRPASDRHGFSRALGKCPFHSPNCKNTCSGGSMNCWSKCSKTVFSWVHQNLLNLLEPFLHRFAESETCLLQRLQSTKCIFTGAIQFAATHSLVKGMSSSGFFSLGGIAFAFMDRAMAASKEDKEAGRQTGGQMISFLDRSVQSEI